MTFYDMSLHVCAHKQKHRSGIFLFQPPWKQLHATLAELNM